MIILPSGPRAGDQLLFQLRAEGGQAQSGTFRVVHIDDGGGLFATVAGDITCVHVDSGIAVTTGIIRQAWFRDFDASGFVGTDVAITVADEGSNDTLGFDFQFLDGVAIPACEKVPPVHPLVGNFIIH